MRELAVVTILAASLAGCVDGKLRPLVASTHVEAATQPAAATEGASRSNPADSDVMAYVNGRAIYMNELNDFLVRSYGLSVAQQLIAGELVDQEARKKNISVTEADVQAEIDGMLGQVFAGVSEDQQRKQLLEQMLVQRNISHKQWELIMRRNALLRKLAAPTIAAVTDEELRKEFGSRYGRKVEVRHIQAASLAEAQQIRKLAETEDFATLAKKHSKNLSAKDGGLLPPIGEDTPTVPPAIRQAAVALKKVAEVSHPIQVGTTFHVLRLERIIEPQDADFADVKDELAAELHRRRIYSTQQQLLLQLIREAKRTGKIEYVHPVLKDHASEAERSQP